jgi:hypothetical protein
MDRIVYHGRFDPVSMLEKLRGKRIMFVGDSLQLGQWLSFVCLVNSAVPDTPGAKSMERSRTLSVYTVEVRPYPLDDDGAGRRQREGLQLALG